MKKEPLCELCYLYNKMRDIKETLSDLPDIGVPLFDGAVEEVAEIVDTACNTLYHYCQENEEQFMSTEDAFNMWLSELEVDERND